jgi:hypothetical protein
MDTLFGWDTAGGLGLLLAGLGIFFWGMQFLSSKTWRKK